MWDAIANASTGAFHNILVLIGNFLTALTTSGGALHDLLPLFAIGIAISLVMVAVKIVRKVTWGA